MKKLGVAVLLTLLALPHPTLAQGASEASARQYLQLTNADQSLNQILAVLFQRAASQLRAQNPTITNETLTLVGESLKQVLLQNIEGYRTVAASALQKVLTEEELQAAIAFYSSPVGQSIASKSGQLSQASAAAGQEWIAALQPALEAAVQQAISQ